MTPQILKASASWLKFSAGATIGDPARDSFDAAKPP
jgi:hypothetical protein